MAGELPMGLLCRQSLAEHLDADRVFRITTDGFGVFERQFDFPYPFGKYDQVFVPQYNGGAMENVGCVTVRDEYVFRSRATPATYLARDDTLLHELSHMWFGDLVTMRWWDDLWLKESFATWASNFASSELADDPATAWASFTNGFKSWAYRQDQLPSTHPIAADMVDLEAVEQNFDGITYSKGASVLVQLVAFVGREAFLSGVRGYFAEHAYGNTELADLLRALERASGRDLSGWSAQWLETTGVNTLRADFALDADGTFTRFAVQQSADPEHPTLRDHRIAIGLYAGLEQPGGPVLRRIGRVETDIGGASTDVAELVGLRQPDLVLLNDDDLSYAKVRLDPRSLATVVGGLPQLESPLARAVCWASTWDMCRDAELPAADYVELALRGVAIESDHTAVESVLGQSASAIRQYSPLSVRERLQRRWQSGIADLLAAAVPGSDHQLALAKAYPAAATDDAAANRLAGWLAGVGRAGRARHRPRAALEHRAEPRPVGAPGGGRDRRRAGAGPDHHRGRAGGSGPGGATDRRGQGRGLAVGGRDRLGGQRNPARRLSGLLAARSGRRVGALRRALSADGGGDLGEPGRMGHPRHLAPHQRAPLPLPGAARPGPVPGPARHLARRTESWPNRCAGRSRRVGTTWSARCAARPRRRDRTRSWSATSSSCSTRSIRPGPAEDWDVVGLAIGSRVQPVTRIAYAVDCTVDGDRRGASRRAPTC